VPSPVPAAQFHRAAVTRAQVSKSRTGCPISRVLREKWGFLSRLPGLSGMARQLGLPNECMAIFRQVTDSDATCDTKTVCLVLH
jgi:hypothetical protein